MSDPLELFRQHARQIFDLGQAQQTLEWDQQVMMPPRGLDQRAGQLSALAAVVHGKVADPGFGELIARLEAAADLSELARADVREARRAHDRAVKIPGRLVSARAEACALAQAAWVEARTRCQFALFLPHLERVLALTREMADAVGGANRYDALLDDFEPDMTEAQLRAIFRDLKARLVPLLDAVRGAARRPDRTLLRRRFDLAGQRTFCLRLLQDMGFDLEAGRFDVSAHPFTNGTMHDVRLTTRYLEDYLPPAVFGTIHEGGHGLYEQGLDPERFRDPAGQACSMGIHESQSRFWENLVGRSRPFWSHYYEPLRRACPGSLDGVSPDAFFAAVNAVTPGPIRLEADETTYNLHIILRFELERALLAGSIEVRALPQVWREKMREYLGVTPDTDREGVLQDVHWAGGAIGYFPSYALGNIYAAQLLRAAEADIGSVDALVSAGEFRVLLQWLRQHVHRLGQSYRPAELLRVVTGQPPTLHPLFEHLERKVAFLEAA